MSKIASKSRELSPMASYVTGFVLSILFTVTPFLVVVYHLMSGWMLTFTLAGFAISQLLVQLIFFLHFGRESKPRWNTLVFLFALLVVTILVGGSLWIMNNLDYHMGGHDMDTYIIQDEGIRH